MGLFSKKPRKSNEINNFALKESLAQEAIDRLLVKGRDYQERSELKAEYGYIFLIEEHGFEALFKIMSNVGTFYFAVQGEKIMALDFDEKLFRATSETFLSLHG